jgi:hypothetical protein
LLNIGWTDDRGYGGVTIAIAIIKAKFMPCFAGAWKALTHQSTKLYPAFLTPDTPQKVLGLLPQIRREVQMAVVQAYDCRSVIKHGAIALPNIKGK